LIDSEGVETEYDAIICATGFDARLDSSTTPFIGRNGVTLSQAWDPDPIAYIGVNPPDMPNMFCMFGPNSSPFAGSIVHTFESCTHYIINCVKKLQREYLKSMVCKPQAMANWNRHVDRHMNKTVYSANCVTWFKRNKPEGRVIIGWPGSAMHGYVGHENPRFEDYDYTSWLPEDDSMAWLGNGNTVAEFTDVGDSTLYSVNNTLYLDYSDTSKILAIPSKDYSPPPVRQSVEVNGNGISDKQHEALENADNTPTTNTVLDPNAPADTKVAASGESVAPLGSPVTPAMVNLKPKKVAKFY